MGIFDWLFGKTSEKKIKKLKKEIDLWKKQDEDKEYLRIIDLHISKKKEYLKKNPNYIFYDRLLEYVKEEEEFLNIEFGRSDRTKIEYLKNYNEYLKKNPNTQVRHLIEEEIRSVGRLRERWEKYKDIPDRFNEFGIKNYNKLGLVYLLEDENYKRVQDIIDIDVSKLKFHNFNCIEEWYIDVFKNYNKFEFFLIFTDYHSKGGVLQFEKSTKNTNSKIISKFEDDYETDNDDLEKFDKTNKVICNNHGFSTLQIWKVTSNKFPELIKNKIVEYHQEMEKDEKFYLGEFLSSLDKDTEYLNYESCELIIDSVGLKRDEDLELIFYDQKLDIVRDYNISFDLSSNPLVISYGGYHSRGEHELFLGVIEKRKKNEK